MVLSSFTAPALVAVEHNNKKKKVIQLYDFGAAAGSGPAEYIHISTKMKGGLEAITTPPPPPLLLLLLVRMGLGVSRRGQTRKIIIGTNWHADSHAASLHKTTSHLDSINNIFFLIDK